MTTKGELVRSILFPPPLDFQFHRDFLKSIYVFLTLGLIGMAYSLTMWIRNGVRENFKFPFPLVVFFFAIRFFDATFAPRFFLSMDPLYPPGLDENRAVDDLYPASWIFSEIILLHWKIFCTVQYTVWFSELLTIFMAYEVEFTK